MAKRQSKAAREAAEHAANVAHARATVAGPDLLAAARPVVNRLREQMKFAQDNLVGVFLTTTEAEALVAAVEKAVGQV